MDGMRGAGGPGLSPMLEVRDLLETMAFYGEVLGFQVIGCDAADEPTWCSLERAGTRITFYTRSPDEGRARPSLSGMLALEVGDAAQLQQRTRALYPRGLCHEGPSGFVVADPNGYRLLFSQAPDGPS